MPRIRQAQRFDQNADGRRFEIGLSPHQAGFESRIDQARDGACKQLGGPSQHDTVGGGESSAPDVSRNESRLLLRRFEGPVSNTVVIVVFRGERNLQGKLVPHPADVVGNQAVGECDDGWRAAITLRKLNDVHIVVLPQLREPFGIRAVPLVDDLVVVSDHEQVVPSLGYDQPKEVVLRLVGVLKLVNAYVGPAETHQASDPRLLPQQAASEVQQAAEVEAVTGNESFTVTPMQR